MLCFKSCDDGSPEKGEEHEVEGDEQEEPEGETLHEQKEEEQYHEEQQEEDYEIEEVELDEKTQEGDGIECLDYPECTSLDLRESDDEKSHDLPPSPRPLSQETRSLTASELLLNKSVP